MTRQEFKDHCYEAIGAGFYFVDPDENTVVLSTHSGHSLLVFEEKDNKITEYDGCVFECAAESYDFSVLTG